MKNTSDELLNYIRSSFNISIDVDAKQFSENAKLRLLNKPLYSVFVSPILFPKIKDRQDIYVDYVKNAFSQYSAALLNMINFEIIDIPSKADMEINFVKSTKKYAGMHHNQNYSYTKHRISVGVVDTDGSIIPFDTVMHVILHEIGHAVGLGHSPNSKDVMGFNSLEPVKLSVNDIFVIQLLYSIGSNKTYFDEEKYIKDCMEEFLHQVPQIKNIKDNTTCNPIQVSQNLIKKLDSISDYKKYKILLQDIKISDVCLKKDYTCLQV